MNLNRPQAHSGSSQFVGSQHTQSSDIQKEADQPLTAQTSSPPPNTSNKQPYRTPPPPPTLNSNSASLKEQSILVNSNQASAFIQQQGQYQNQNSPKLKPRSPPAPPVAAYKQQQQQQFNNTASTTIVSPTSSSSSPSPQPPQPPARTNIKTTLNRHATLTNPTINNNNKEVNIDLEMSNLKNSIEDSAQFSHQIKQPLTPSVSVVRQNSNGALNLSVYTASSTANNQNIPQPANVKTAAAKLAHKSAMMGSMHSLASGNSATNNSNEQVENTQMAISVANNMRNLSVSIMILLYPEKSTI
jgi:hypothetical protein